MRHGSLFSGIGGFDLAAEWLGWENVFHCEINLFGRKILKHYWPNAISYEDIRTTDFTIHRGAVDILTGGFPCQPFSTAGKRKGTGDERHLWPEMLRAIREIQPKWIVGENVFGLINWDGGVALEQVQLDLEIEGYEVQPFILPACSVGAPHRRDRIWFVAHTKNNTCFNDARNEGSKAQKVQKKRPYEPIPSAAASVGYKRNWKRFPLESPILTRHDGISEGLVGISVSAFEFESIKAYGNAIVPDVVLQIFKAIEQYNLAA